MACPMGFPLRKAALNWKSSGIFSRRNSQTFSSHAGKAGKNGGYPSPAGRGSGTLKEKLLEMSYSGLLRRDCKGDNVYFSAVPFVVGIFEPRSTGWIRNWPPNLKPTLIWPLCDHRATEAIELVRKDQKTLYVPPKTGMRTYMEIAQYRSGNP